MRHCHAQHCRIFLLLSPGPTATLSEAHLSPEAKGTPSLRIPQSFKY